MRIAWTSRPKSPAKLAGLLLLAAAFGIAGAAAAAPPGAYPQPILAIENLALDDPKAAIAFGEEALARGPSDPETAFWQHLGLAGVHIMMEQTHAAQREVGQARALLARMPAAGARHALWLEAYAIGTGFRTDDVGLLMPRSVALRRAATELGDPALLCEIAAGDLFMLRNANALDEAWLAGEETERCGRALGLAHLESPALIALGGMASALAGKAPTQRYFERALDSLGKRPARFQRAWIEWERGSAWAQQGDGVQATRAYETALALSRGIGDATGTAIVLVDLAALRLNQGDPVQALALVREALPSLSVDESPPRVAAARGLVIEALTALKRPEVLAEIERAQRLASVPLPAQERVRLARRIAQGYASQGLHAQAYAELLHSTQAMAEGQQSVRDAQMLRLQARYETTRRDAEVADLRHRAETSRLALQAREAQERALWAALAVLAGLFAFAVWRGRLALARRRQLAELAMRDELTDMPNRRAVLAFGQEQFGLCRRLGLRLAVAVVDLDHFKRVNDRHGHAAGDRVLIAFARAAQGVLRGQDRIGRYGGDEWLLVMPGAGVGELAPAFERLRERFAAEAIEGLSVPHGLTLSMGGAELGPGTESLEDLIAEADRQLFLAKDDGRNALRHPPSDAACGRHPSGLAATASS